MICCANRCWQWGYLNHIKPSFIYIYIYFCVSWKSFNKCLDASWGCIRPRRGCTLLCVHLATAGMMSVCSFKHLCACMFLPVYHVHILCITPEVCASACVCFRSAGPVFCFWDVLYSQSKAGGVARPSSITTEGKSQIGGDWLLWTYMYMHTGYTCTLNCLQWYDCIRRFRTCRLHLHRAGILCCRGWNRCTYTCLERVRHL